jgi:hypothetical protein
MPNFNKTGPVGQGSMTGRRMGRCSNFGAGRRNQPETEIPNEKRPENIEMGFGRGARGRGRGMGLRNRFRGDFM